MTGPLAGVIAAIPTPVTATGDPDLPRFVRLATSLLERGCDGLNVCGTTGEATSLSVAQRLEVMRAAASSLPRDRLMVGTGAAAAADAATLTRAAGDLGFRAALVLPPFYYKAVSERGIKDYFVYVAERSEIDLYIYNFPQLSSIRLDPPIIQDLARALPGRVLGIKDSSGDLAYARTVASLGLAVFPSSEEALDEARSGVFSGCISATANLTAELCAAAWRSGDDAALVAACAVRAVAAAGPLIPRVKAALSVAYDDPALALVLPPHVALGPEESARLAAQIVAARAVSLPLNRRVPPT